MYATDILKKTRLSVHIVTRYIMTIDLVMVLLTKIKYSTVRAVGHIFLLCKKSETGKVRFCSDSTLDGKEK